MSRKFSLGQMIEFSYGVCTLMDAETRFSMFVLDCLKRHVKGDWDNLPKSEKKANDFNLNVHIQLEACYHHGHWSILIVKQADRAYTTVMFPEEKEEILAYERKYNEKHDFGLTQLD